MSRIRVGVLMGGRSVEKEVSFNSGRTICDHLDTTRFDVIPLFQTDTNQLFILPWRFLYRGKIVDFSSRLEAEAQRISWDILPEHIDFVYIATHGRYAEDGTLQAFLEILGLPYLGSKVYASALGMDKIQQKAVLKMHNIDVPRDLVVMPHDLKQPLESWVRKLEEHELTFPLIIKPYKEGSSLGMTVIQKPDDLISALMYASTIHPGTMQPVLIEEIISGMEFTCITLTNYSAGRAFSLPPTEIIAEAGTAFFDYEQKYMPGRATKYTPARCSKILLTKIQETCINVMNILGMQNLARIDGFVTQDKRIVIIDPNTLSGMAPSSFLFRQAAEAGMGHADLINHLIDTELHMYGIKTMTTNKHSNAQDKKLRIAVILGGRSNEKEISLESGRNITYKLAPAKYEVIPLFLNDDMKLYPLSQQLLVRHSTKEIKDGLSDMQPITWESLKDCVDFAFLGLHGGEGENGTIQGTLEFLGIPYNGSSIMASALCMDKYKSNMMLKHHGIAVPEARLIARNEWNKNTSLILQQLQSFPYIVKPHDDGCSVLVHKSHNKAELSHALEEIFLTKDHALLEECIVGMELTVGVIGNDIPYALPPSRAVAQAAILSIEEKFLPGAGENQTPAPLSPATLAFIKSTIENAYTLLGCKGYARIDCFYQDAQQSPSGQERVIVLETNTLPALTPATVLFHQAAEIGLKPMDVLDTIIELGLEAHVTEYQAKHSLLTKLDNQRRLARNESA
ncbi:hypothetical protein JW872_01020 [Candidatus Babeliales bacterium]|nr:hypothetical protein [Candidatus Babeliales bacterium]